jgi:anaerobic carbon-monoxide dehydrogenase iron sulfur subunit
MKTVIVHPERCVGCMQCRIACAVEHSKSKDLFGALFEAVRPQARLRIYPGRQHLAFPNKCRHCDPAPCQQVCIAGAISRTPGARCRSTRTAASVAPCAPWPAPSGSSPLRPPPRPRTSGVALKCDQCPDREAVGRVPACVEACKVGALTFGEVADSQVDKGQAIAHMVFQSIKAEKEAGPPEPQMVALWRQLT